MILPVQPGVMLWGGLATILGSILPILGQIPAWIAWLFLSYTIGLVRFFANLPITTLPVSFPLAAVALTYSLILAFTWLSAQGKDVRDRILGGTWPGRIKRAGFVTIGIAAIFLILMLLTGDAEASAERKMLAPGRPLQALIYKAGHHGANTSISTLFLDALQPQYIVISAGQGNQYEHPHEEMLERAEAVGAAVLRTDLQGTIEVISDGRSYWWEIHQ